MTVRRRLRVLIVLPGLALAGAAAWYFGGAKPVVVFADAVFVAKPFVQLGDAPTPAADGTESIAVLWLGHDREESWFVDTQRGDSGDRVAAETPSVRRIAVEGVAPHRLYRARLTGLTPGAEFTYRVRRAGGPDFEARARARRPPGQPHRVVVFGDCGARTAAQRAVADQTWRARPDLVVLTGDIVYTQGRLTDYLIKYFPIYNHDAAAPGVGVPLLRSTLVAAAPGNHDLAFRDLDAMPDALAYFAYWSQPLNGPIGTADHGPTRWLTLTGAEDRRAAFRATAGAAFPRMANFSFDYGDVHWTVLDTNTYVDLTDPEFRDWIDRDLAAARRAAWRFVVFHQPPFNSSKAHADDQRTRLLVDLFERNRVDLVFCGHVHNYQRTYPLRFASAAATADASGGVAGRVTIDSTFDGRTHTRPDGIIYLISGGGGARLYDTSQGADPASWSAYTARFVSDRHSLTLVDVAPDSLTVRQVSDEGQELDRFTVTRAAADMVR